jgi:hypothetical protein
MERCSWLEEFRPAAPRAMGRVAAMDLVPWAGAIADIGMTPI